MVKIDDQEWSLVQYNDFANRYSEEFKERVQTSLKSAAEKLSGRPFDVLTVDARAESVEVEVEVEVDSWIPWRKRIEKKKQKKEVPASTQVSPGWYLTCLAMPDEREDFDSGGWVEHNHRYWLFLEPTGQVRCFNVTWHTGFWSPHSAPIREGKLSDDGLISPIIFRQDGDRIFEQPLQFIGLIGLDMPCPESIDRYVPKGPEYSYYRRPSILPLPVQCHKIEDLVQRCLKRPGPVEIKNDEFKD